MCLVCCFSEQDGISQGKDLPLVIISKDSSHGQCHTSPDSFTSAREKFKQKAVSFNRGEDRTAIANNAAGLLCLAAAERATFGT